jgi:predicted PurR-regulated permease PerM
LIADSRTRRGLGRIASGLIAYGVVGLVVALIGLAVVGTTAGRLGSLGAKLPAEIDRLTVILERTADALDEAGATATSFSGTIDRTGPAVRQSATAVRDIVPQLRSLESQASAISIFGSQPLAPLGQLFGQIAGELDGLDVQLDTIAEQLTANGGALVTNAASLGELAGEVRSLGGRLEAGSEADGIGDVSGAVAALAIVLLILAAIPAAGALALGAWLRRFIGEMPGAAIPPAGATD